MNHDNTSDNTPTTSTGVPDGPLACTAADRTQIGRYRVIKLLGKGAFGHVYLAQDDELDRRVAIKVPNPERISAPADLEAYLKEARALARLEHPNIVPVYDVGRTVDGLCFVVSKFIEGSDLAAKIKQGRPGFRESAELAATVAEALHYAHTRGLVHRDVKPANILIDVRAKPYVADFGLAIKDEDFGREVGVAGTPAYMSPEQARGEGHRMDGRSDIFSLGVVLYELLTGRRPFQARSLSELFDVVSNIEARPPRQIDDGVPKDLERICLKALSKRASGRYTTASDMAEDLRGFLQSAGNTVLPARPLTSVDPAPGPTQETAPVPSTWKHSESSQQPIKIVPKGLRSFDEHDADFFLELLPGARDREGLPESIRFWKTKIDITDADKTFPVGLIYGPSGCGKSSLVKAGLLPLLGKHVLPVYVEATADETESRLLKALRKTCPELAPERGLVDVLALLRRGHVLRSSQKVLLVLDQFEQWLHARRLEENTELVAALRHCDGGRVQAVVLVRDDFWMAATRFMKDLEVRLHEGENSTAVDLFDPVHARKVLAAFGRARGALPQTVAELTPLHQAFLDQSVLGLASDGKVVPVRLALFSEMVKGKPWGPATLRAVGGTEGVGVAFLEETFSSATAPPQHRFHQRAAQAVLEALLPESGTDLKGQMRSEAELRTAAGHTDRPSDFIGLIAILDGELRLITPTDPDVSDDQVPAAVPPTAPQRLGGRYYQLTHDYLVPSLRAWLTRKQRETRRGRARFRLAERSALWNAKPEKRFLPSAWEWAGILLLTKKSNWTRSEQRMMRRAGQVHGLRASGLAVLAGVLAAAGLNIQGRIAEYNRATTASGLVQQLLKVETAQVPDVLRTMKPYRRWTDPELIKVAVEAPADSRSKLHASLALVPNDPSQVEFLFKRLQSAVPNALPALRDALAPHRSQLTPRLWSILQSAEPGDARILPTAGALAVYDPQGVRWGDSGGKVAEGLVTVNSLDLGLWLEALRPVRQQLITPLIAIFRDKARSDATAHSLATDILVDYASDDPQRLAELLMVADHKAFPKLFTVAELASAPALVVLQAELAKQATPSWNDQPLDSSWPTPDSALTARIELAQGLIAERVALCLSMPLDDFREITASLQTSGYRPIRFRPYALGQEVKVAAVWVRDGRPSRIASGLTGEELRAQDNELRGTPAHGRRGSPDSPPPRYVPVDVAGYLAPDRHGTPAIRYAGLWALQAEHDDDARMYVGATAGQEKEAMIRLRDAKLVPRTRHAVLGSGDEIRYSGVWGRPSRAGETALEPERHSERTFEQALAAPSDHLLLDLTVHGACRPPTIRERAQASLAAAEMALKANPNDLNARCDRAQAFIGLGDDRKALDDLRAVLEKSPQLATARQHRAIVCARLGQKKQAQDDLAAFQKADVGESYKLYLAAVVAEELGTGHDEAFDKLEAALKRQPGDAALAYNTACAYALASRAAARTDRARSQSRAARALCLLETAIKSGYADYDHIQEDSDLDPIRDLPAFVELVKEGHPDRRYSAVWSSDIRFEATSIHGQEPVAALRRSHELIAQGYRPVSLSIARTLTGGPLVTASVWHRPTVSEQAKDDLAERQARAAAALVRLGHAEPVWPLLVHSSDPRLRSFIVNWLKPLGADPAVVAAEFARLGSPAHHGTEPSAGRIGNPSHIPPAPAGMSAILFDPGTSIRRALILALGTYGPDAVSSGERDPLIARLLDLYQNDPDAGIHGAAEWALRQWKQADKLTKAQAELSKLTDKGARRWFVNSEGQTFALVDGPVEFRMGSPPNEPDRVADETPHPRVIPRRFAIADKEVTVEQYERFARENPQFALTKSSVDKHSPDPSGPMIAVNWFGAAAYCNWLSKQEGLPKDQWCYQPNERGDYAAGMTIPNSALERIGYRLPAETEWEYACRAGTVTSRYHGFSVGLLKAYARYAANSDEHAWPGGSLLPNDLGLFDMLGNVYEWCQDRLESYKPGSIEATGDEIVDIRHHRLLRGGAFLYRPADGRSALRAWSRAVGPWHEPRFSRRQDLSLSIFTTAPPSPSGMPARPGLSDFGVERIHKQDSCEAWRMTVLIKCTRAKRWIKPSWVGIVVMTAALTMVCGQPGLPRAWEPVDSEPARESKGATNGPLRVHPANPRYLCDRSDKVVFLTGSHTWGNLQDYTYATAPSPPPMDFQAYLAFLKAHNHNFFRLWTWESSLNPNPKQSTTSYDPMPYERVGPATALDGKPRFDVARFNQAYFDRLRTRVAAARHEGIYVSVMLFQGFSIEGKGNLGGDPWKGHPFNPKNNVEGFDGGGRAKVHTLADPALTAHQEAYVRKVIDTVNDLDNVLYEITNEDTGGPANTEWQIHIINFIKRHEAAKAQQHPVGMTAQWPEGKDEILARSPADWISPAGRFYAGDGKKVVLNDTDHSFFWTGLKEAGIAAQRAWVWVNFTGGNQCLFMDPYLDPSHDPGRNDPAAGRPDPYWEPLRTAMGQTRTFALRINLAAMVPHDELASTKHCLADPGREYLLYLPAGGETVLDLSMGSARFHVEWMQPDGGKAITAPGIVGGAKRSLKAPFSGDAILYVRKQ